MINKLFCNLSFADQYINSVWWESRIITTQPGEINYRKPEFIAFVVNVCVNIPTNTFDV